MPGPKPELMSPVGYWPELKAAIEAGADAVYFGLHHFTARAKVGFDIAELPEVMKTLHRRGVKGFVTFNTLVFDQELLEAEKAIIHIAKAGADAIIVQDVAIASLAKQIAPDLEVHGSTQMSITSSQGAELAKSLGCSRVVLGRELSLKDIERIAKATDVELEVFVHGALCVSYSGQCFSSEAWGGRSANRGKCAQACRLPYELIVDGKKKDLGEYRYLLSPGDLYALHQIPDLVRIGVACFKIEGRYKDAEYVAAVTQAYRKAIDEACADLPLTITKEEEQHLEQVYSRGLGDYFISGVNHQKVVRGRAPRHRGVYAGEVVKVWPDVVQVKPIIELKPGDGVVFDAASWRSPDEKEEGGSIYAVKRQSNAEVLLEFANYQIDFSRIRKGDLLWRTHDPQLAKLYKPITNASEPLYTRAVSFSVKARAGEALVLTATSEDKSVTVTGSIKLEPAQKRGLDEGYLREHLGLGGTPFHLDKVSLDAPQALFVPVSDINALRREAVEQLLVLRTTKAKAPTSLIMQERLEHLEKHAPTIPTQARLHVLIRTPEQLEAALDRQPESITLDYLELYGLKPSVEKVKAAGIRCRVASPRILKPTEQNIVKFLSSLECEILVRSSGLLYDLRNTRKVKLSGDFSLNAANAISANMYLEMGLSSIAPTHDLNAQQIADLCKYVSPEKLEVIAYHHLPVFHTEHCVFCRFLSKGTDYTNCGHPCETHRIALKDKQGREHPVMADVGCRNTVYGAEAQVGTRHLELWLKAGLRDFRLEFVHETASNLQEIIRGFQQVFSERKNPKWLEQQLKRMSPTGITEGSLFVPEDFSHLPQLF